MGSFSYKNHVLEKLTMVYCTLHCTVRRQGDAPIWPLRTDVLQPKVAVGRKSMQKVGCYHPMAAAGTDSGTLAQA